MVNQPRKSLILNLDYARKRLSHHHLPFETSLDTLGIQDGDTLKFTRNYPFHVK